MNLKNDESMYFIETEMYIGDAAGRNSGRMSKNTIHLTELDQRNINITSRASNQFEPAL